MLVLGVVDGRSAEGWVGRGGVLGGDQVGMRVGMGGAGDGRGCGGLVGRWGAAGCCVEEEGDDW